MFRIIKFSLYSIFLLVGFYFFLSGYKILINPISEKELFLNKSILTIKKESPDLLNDIIIEKNINNIAIDDQKNGLKEIVIKIKKNTTFAEIIDEYITSNDLKYKIINNIQKKYDLRKLRANHEIYLYQNSNNKIQEIKIPIENTKNLIIFLKEDIRVEVTKLKSNTELRSDEYIINDSLYADGIKNNIPAEILTKLIKLYSFDLDFQRDIRKNTTVSISYESIIIDERNKEFYGDIIYALIKIEKNTLEYFFFKTDDGYIDYFNKKGENVKKSILKTPLDGAKLSSGFGVRKHPILGYDKMHKGVDFAAPTGTPIFAGGNGVIEFAGNNGGYGKYIRIRHNNEYKTAYAHLSGFKKGIGKGVRVNQGDIIGYVGSTGRSTGPHLHYEILYQNKQINPLKLKLPPGKKLKGDELERFVSKSKAIYANHLNLLYE